MDMSLFRPSLRLGCLLLGLGAASTAQAQEGLVSEGVFTWINAVRYSVLGEHPLNPDNSVLEIPRVAVVSEFRPNFKIAGEKLQLVARPRVRMMWSEIEAGDAEPVPKGYSEYEMNEAFAYWLLSDHFAFTVGLQSYQWGPAESLSPSNRLFHETALARDVLYEVRGRHLARLNYSLGQGFSVVLLSEYQESDEEAPFLAEEAFATTTAVKAELSFGGGAHYIGLVGGGREHGRPWLGEYASLALPFPEGTSVYFDAAHQRGSSAYYPISQTGPAGPVEVVSLEQTRKDEDRVETIAVSGLRYDFVQGTIARLEYIWNEPGYDQTQQDLVRAALVSEELAQQATKGQLIGRSHAAGLELPGKRYAFASLFVPDFLTVDDLTATGRALVSLTDQSTNSYLALEYEVGDAGTAFMASSLSSGEQDSELAGFTKQSHIGGYRYIW